MGGFLCIRRQNFSRQKGVFQHAEDATFAEEKTTVPFMDMFMVKRAMR